MPANKKPIPETSSGRHTCGSSAQTSVLRNSCMVGVARRAAWTALSKTPFEILGTHSGGWAKLPQSHCYFITLEVTPPQLQCRCIL